MNISAYILEYLKQFGSVPVPDFGVFSLENSKAIINSENGSILPPAGQIVFTINYETESDELISFISSQRQMSIEAARNDLKIQTDFWKKKLQADQVLEIQNLGTVFIEKNETYFKGKRLETDHPDYYGLEEIRISDIHNSGQSKISENSEKDYKFNKSIVWIFLFILPALALSYLTYTQPELLFGKKSFDNISVQTKIHRIEKDTVKIKADSTRMNISDSLKKDSSVNPSKSKKVPEFGQSKNNTKTTWQK